MNKKANTLLFILGATFFNVIVTIAAFSALALLYAYLLLPHLPEDGRTWGFPLIFIASIAISFAAYRLALKLLVKKVELEKYFDPLFGGQNRKS
jgi:hypothetical protein